MTKAEQMSSSNPSPVKGSRVRRLVGETGWTRARAIASLGMVFGLGAVGTMAAWSDTAQATSGMFSTSAENVKIGLDQAKTFDFEALAQKNLARGSSVAGMIPVKNLGSNALTYTIQSNSANNGTASYGQADADTFAENLKVSVYRGGTSSATSCTGTAVVSNVALTLGPKGVVTAGQPLDVGQGENLCFQITLAGDAPIQARMSALAINFTFAAIKA